MTPEGRVTVTLTTEQAVRGPVDTERERLRPHGTQQRNPWKGS